MKAEAVVIGGGFAGIAAAARLAERGRRVTLLERKRFLGGRAFSFDDPQTGERLDNGPHLLMGCYRHTLELLELIGTRDKLRAQPYLKVDFLDERGHFHRFSCRGEGFRALLKGLRKLSSIGAADKWRTVFLLPALLQPRRAAGLTVVQWLDRCRQSHVIRRHFWEPLCFAVLNENPALASAELLVRVLREAFFGPSGSSSLLLPQEGLTALAGEKAQDFLMRHGGQTLKQAAARRLIAGNGRVTGVELSDGTVIEGDFFISALPPHALEKILPPELLESPSPFSQLGKIKHSPIVAVHLRLSARLSGRPFFALLNSPVHWVFSHPTDAHVVSLVVSGAHEWAGLANEEIRSAVERELIRFFPKFHPSQIEKMTVIKEPHATVTPSPEMQRLRLSVRTQLPNFFLAGDWTATGLPATIESAVKSGLRAAEFCLDGTADAGAGAESTMNLSVCFKEWAVVVEALLAGRQTVIFRKGGIVEEKGAFRADRREFLLFPTYLHQNAGDLVETERENLRRLHVPPDENGLKITGMVRVEQVHYLRDFESVKRAQPFGIWSLECLEERFNWGKEKGIHLIAGRVYRLPATATLPMLQRYGGCRSWVELEKPVGAADARPVLSDAAFAAKLREIEGSLS